MKNNKENFATTRSFTSTYAGEAAAPYLLKALVGGETLSTAGISILTGVKYKETMKRFASSNILQAGSNCDFNPTGTLTISERALEPKKIKVNAQICFNDLYTLWDSASMSAGANDESFPAALEQAIISEFTNQVAKEVETVIWQGSGTYGITGWEAILCATGATASIKVTGTTLTSSNILTEMNKVVNAMPAAIKSKKAKGELVLFVSHKAAFLYEQNLSAQGMNTSVDGKPMSLYGIEIKPVGGLSNDNIMFLGARDNFYFGTDLQDDFANVQLLDQRFVTGADYLNFVMRGKFDVNIGWAEEVVAYGCNL
jgi:hypothetical protein